jgi:hypothetical protein
MFKNYLLNNRARGPQLLSFDYEDLGTGVEQDLQTNTQIMNMDGTIFFDFDGGARVRVNKNGVPGPLYLSNFSFSVNEGDEVYFILSSNNPMPVTQTVTLKNVNANGAILDTFEFHIGASPFMP